MANELSEEQTLALWMIERMRGSEEFLNLIRQQRVAGSPDGLDTPENIARHAERVAPLYRGESGEALDVPEKLAAAMAAVGMRDLLSCPEEMIEKAIAAYLKQHPSGEDDLPTGWKSTFALAEAEVRGEVRGQFAPNFVAALADRAREEQQRMGLAQDRSQTLERE